MKILAYIHFLSSQLVKESCGGTKQRKKSSSEMCLSVGKFPVLLFGAKRGQNRIKVTQDNMASVHFGVSYLMSGCLSSPLHITCLALTNNLAIFSCSRRANIVTLPESLSLFSRGDFEKELVVSM